mmetsp:Transcript_9646/g.10986  ORF Transcript_9646/g.10986 Transcript_9646/m.10986 type:complete len:295 (+) Transcript_9646:272-1156(+)|eukprot:CAMPEP_0184072690 /NCGR_PEP_ID=MMETSP0957-20130417/60514_1 /TAXON_ID=627963 /ORGANISM="Aplanochytrium sp, Strain PBS07" /LENGTH=294 /DNA_ID=CAMNT_0026373901 /DNA_START=258 /DNA_END=1142 /DNA_ORIENTATION=-
MAPPTQAVVHPLVLLSVVDHYNRVAKDIPNKRVVGCLLGETYQGRVDVSNSFAVPFEEDPKDNSIWYLDHNFLENMYGMFKKVSAKEKIVGFYSTGPKIKANDLEVDVVFRRYVQHPLLVIIDVRPDSQGIPTQAYYSVELVDEAKNTARTFANVPSEVGAYEAEEVGVEHLLRDINDPTVTTLASRVQHKMAGLNELKSKLEEMHTYLDNVHSGKMPVNNQVVYNMQDIFNLLPNLNIESLVKSFFIKTNDMHLVIYLSSLIRSIIALHDLLNNQLKYEDYTRVVAEGDSKSK